MFLRKKDLQNIKASFEFNAQVSEFLQRVIGEAELNKDKEVVSLLNQVLSMQSQINHEILEQLESTISIEDDHNHKLQMLVDVLNSVVNGEYTPRKASTIIPG